jgi:hypothetical protein
VGARLSTTWTTLQLRPAAGRPLSRWIRWGGASWAVWWRLRLPFLRIRSSRGCGRCQPCGSGRAGAGGGGWDSFFFSTARPYLVGHGGGVHADPRRQVRCLGGWFRPRLVAMVAVSAGALVAGMWPQGRGRGARDGGAYAGGCWRHVCSHFGGCSVGDDSRRRLRRAVGGRAQRSEAGVRHVVSLAGVADAALRLLCVADALVPL